MVRRPRQRAGMCPGRGRRREEVDGGRSCRPPSAARGLRATARPGEDDPIAHREDPVPHREERAVAGPDHGPGGDGCQAPCEQGRAVQGSVRQQERAAGEARHGAQARPAARRSRPRPYPAARARGAHRQAQPAQGRARVLLLRQALCRQRRARLDRHRDRGQGPQTQDRPPPLAPELRMPVLAPGSDGAPAAAPVPQDTLRNQRVGELPLRALRLSAAPQPGLGVAVRPRSADRCRHARRQRGALHPHVRARGGRDPRAPEPTGGPSRRRDRLAYPVAARDRPLQPRVAVELGQRRCGLLPLRPLALGRGREDVVRRYRRRRVRWSATASPATRRWRATSTER